MLSRHKWKLKVKRFSSASLPKFRIPESSYFVYNEDNVCKLIFFFSAFFSLLKSWAILSPISDASNNDKPQDILKVANNVQ